MFSQFSGCWLILSVYILMSFDYFPLEDCSEFGNFVITLMSDDSSDITIRLFLYRLSMMFINEVV
jgi:hypothetical protein